jgi:hypothetical protein
MNGKYEMKDMSGSAFHNTRRDRDTSPDLTGSAMVYGKEHWVNMWLKTDKNGKMWVSFNLKEKQPSAQAKPKEREEIPPLNDHIPF